MTYTAYKFRPEYLTERRADLALQTKGRDLLDVLSLAVVAKLDGHRDRYLQFGPYWPAVKAAVRPLRDFGPYDEPLIRSEYCARDAEGKFDPVLSLIAGQEFADEYLETMMAGTRHFDLSGDSTEDDPIWGLFDPDLEGPE